MQQLNKNKKIKADFKHQMKTLLSHKFEKNNLFYNSYVHRNDTTKPANNHENEISCIYC